MRSHNPLKAKEHSISKFTSKKFFKLSYQPLSIDISNDIVHYIFITNNCSWCQLEYLTKDQNNNLPILKKNVYLLRKYLSAV